MDERGDDGDGEDIESSTILIQHFRGDTRTNAVTESCRKHWGRGITSSPRSRTGASCSWGAAM